MSEHFLLLGFTVLKGGNFQNNKTSRHLGQDVTMKLMGYEILRKPRLWKYSLGDFFIRLLARRIYTFLLLAEYRGNR